MRIEEIWLSNLKVLVQQLGHGDKRSGYRNISDATGLSEEYIYQLVEGKPKKDGSLRQVGKTAARKIANSRLGLGKPFGWFDNPIQNSQSGNVDAARSFIGEVPLISWVQAGNWHEAADAHQPGDVETYLPVHRRHGSNTYALRVRGDSMTAPHGKSYPEGCYIIVDPDKRAPNNGDRVIARIKGADEVTFKVYKNEDGRQWLQPLNPAHLPIREPFTVLGTIIGKWEDD